MTIQTCYDIHIEIVEFPSHLELPAEEFGGGYYFDNDDDLTTSSSSSSSSSSYSSDEDDDDDDDCGSSCCEDLTEVQQHQLLHSYYHQRLNDEDGDDEEEYLSGEEDSIVANKLLRRQYMQREIDNDSIGMARRRGIPRWSSPTTIVNDNNHVDFVQEEDRYDTLNDDNNDNNIITHPGEFIYGYEMESYDIPLKGFEDYDDEDSSESSSEEDDDDDDEEDELVVVQEEEECQYGIPLLKSSNSNHTLNRLISRTYSSGTLR